MFPMHPKFRRLQLLRDGDLPTRTEIRSYLGSQLAEIFNDYSDETTRKLLGIVPPLKGPQEELWISPSDQLIGKVALKPPLTNKCIKACTHQGILEIGKVAILGYEAETEEKIRQRLRNEFIENRKMFEAEKRRAVELAVGKLESEHEKYIELLNEDFAKRLELSRVRKSTLRHDMNNMVAVISQPTDNFFAALDEAAKKSAKEIQKAVVRERMEVTLGMMKKLREEIGRVVVSMNDEFEQSIRAQRDTMVADFNAIMRRERGRVDDRMKSLEQKNAEEMHSQRRELELQNMADASYILCTERMRCGSEKHALHQRFEKQIEALQRLFVESTKDGSLAEEEIAENDFFQVVEIIDKDGKKWRPIQLRPEVPQLECTEEQLEVPIVSSEINYFPPDEYTDRMSEPSAKSLHSYDSLPFCYYENKLYVRSDYREEETCTVAPDEKKTMEELSEGARFIMELKRSPYRKCRNHGTSSKDENNGKTRSM